MFNKIDNVKGSVLKKTKSDFSTALHLLKGISNPEDLLHFISALNGNGIENFNNQFLAHIRREKGLPEWVNRRKEQKVSRFFDLCQQSLLELGKTQKLLKLKSELKNEILEGKTTVSSAAIAFKEALEVHK